MATNDDHTTILGSSGQDSPWPGPFSEGERYVKTMVSQVMTKDLSAVEEEDSILEAVRIFHSQRISGIPVVRSNWILTGYLSEGDILRAALPTYVEVLMQHSFLDNSEGSLFDRLQALGRRRVKEFMCTDPVSVDTSASLMAVADLMLRKRLKRLPVVEEGRLVGVVDRATFCGFMMDREE